MFKPIYEPRTRKTRISSHGYVLVKYPEHPNADKNGEVYEHRLIMENKLGRALEPHELVHHENEKKQDNSPDNLVLKKSIAYHKLEHRKNSNMQRPDEPNVIIECACGCGKSFLKYDSNGRPRKYHHHCNWRKGKFEHDFNEKIECACGCGESINKYDKYGRIRRYINGHNPQSRTIYIEPVLLLNDKRNGMKIKVICQKYNIKISTYYKKIYEYQRGLKNGT